MVSDAWQRAALSLAERIEEPGRVSLGTTSLAAPQTDDELHQAVWELTGMRIPRVACCSNHSSPFDALAEAYFARAPISVWKASRGFGGKTKLLSILAFLEQVFLGASVTLLGGSGEQSARVHEYMIEFWNAPGAPRHLLIGDPSHRQTRLTNGGRVRALMASQRSVRGAHPQRLRCDEIDEIKLEILDASFGQPMGRPGIPSQVTMSSTQQYADGTMATIMKRAAVGGWSFREWCYRETMRSDANPDGWLDPDEVAQKRTLMPAAMWESEVENQEPNPQNRALVTEKVEAMFRVKLGQFQGRPGEYIEIEAPQTGASYSTGADWAKEQDWTVIVTIRRDTKPARVVAFERIGRQPWPRMVERFNARVIRYPGRAFHDATGGGNVVRDYLTVPAVGEVLVGRRRSDILSNYISAVEDDRLSSPMIQYMYGEHKFASMDDMFGSGHLPDSVCAMALAWRGVSRVAVGSLTPPP